MTQKINIFKNRSKKEWVMSILAIVSAVAIHYSQTLFALRNFVRYQHSNGLSDIGHYYIPVAIKCLTIYGCSWLLWAATFSLQLFYVLLLIYIFFTGKGIRLALCLFTVDWLHWLFYHFTVLPDPDGIVSSFPPSALSLVPKKYCISSDFWFSGHTAGAMVIVLSAFTTKYTWLKLVSLFVLLAEIVIVLSIRVHYSIDVIGAIFVAYSVHKFSYALDPYAMKIVDKISRT